MKKIMKKNQVIITSLAILIAVAGYLNFADVDLGFKDKEASTDSSSILEEVEYDLTDETELLIDILSFGPVVRVLGPSSFVRQIRRRVKRQHELFNSEKG